MRGESRHLPSRPRRAGMRGSGQGVSANGDRGTSRPAVTADDAEKLAGLLEPVIAGAGMDLEAVRIARAGRRRLLRIVVDADGGAGLDGIAEVSRKISACLDSSGAMGETPYTLEVSSRAWTGHSPSRGTGGGRRTAWSPSPSPASSTRARQPLAGPRPYVDG